MSSAVNGVQIWLSNNNVNWCNDINYWYTTNTNFNITILIKTIYWKLIYINGWTNQSSSTITANLKWDTLKEDLNIVQISPKNLDIFNRVSVSNPETQIFIKHTFGKNPL